MTQCGLFPTEIVKADRDGIEEIAVRGGDLAQRPTEERRSQANRLAAMHLEYRPTSEWGRRTSGAVVVGRRA